MPARRRQRSPQQRGEYGATLIGEHEVRRRVIALYQIPDEHVLGGGVGYPGLHPIGTGGETEQQHPFRHGEVGRDHFGGWCLEHGQCSKSGHRDGQPICDQRDEGGPFEVGNQVLISNHRKLLWSKAMVVNVAEKPEQDSGRYD
jgi:hypothetical protein